MLWIKYLLVTIGGGLIACGVGVIAVGFWRRAQGSGSPSWGTAGRALGLGAGCMLLGSSLVVVPSGMAGVRVSQLWGTRPGTLYPGVHFVKPLLEQMALYDVRDRVASGVAPAEAKKTGDVLMVQSKEGLGVGLAVTVRYRLDARRLDHIHANLPRGVEEEILVPAVASTFRDLVPHYLVREVFATKRDELRQKATEVLTAGLAPDGLLVKDVRLRDIVLPPEYAKGLESLLLREQESERMVYDIEIKQKEVRTAELEAEAQKVREIKAAEAQAQVRVLQAKGEADAMQHTLPLKEKQIQQTRLETEARKEATLMNADAAAQAKVIDGKAEQQRLNFMAEADAHRIRLTSDADLERMKVEAGLLRDNPLLIQKIVAERLSDKMQIMMVPMDGRNFFANEVFRAAMPTLPAADASAEPERKVASRKH